jgi:putative transcriptional regulator
MEDENQAAGETEGETSGEPTKKRQTVGESIIEGLKQAIAWTQGENENVRVTLVHVPEVDVREVRTKMGLSQAQFATKCGFPPATLRNWEQSRSRPRRAHARPTSGNCQASGGGGGCTAASELTLIILA